MSEMFLMLGHWYKKLKGTKCILNYSVWNKVISSMLNHFLDNPMVSWVGKF